jgi:1-phosphofructokinase family hexose kinase
MIITVTLNPSIDRTISIGTLKRGSVNRAELIAVDPGGKGVNVSRALKMYGASTYAILLGGSLGGRWFGESLAALDIPHQVVMGEGVTRSNVTIVEADGTVTKINEPGFDLTDELLDGVKSALNDLPLSDAWVVFAGRLNPGAPASTYRDLVEFVRSRGARVAVDASGEELREALSAAPDLIKPNQHELAEIVGSELITVADIVSAARSVLAQGVRTVLCSLGADGALYITANEVVHVEPGVAVTGIPVGAGDIMLATFIAGGAHADALAGAVQWSAASVALEGTAIPTPAQAAAMPVLVHTDLEVNRSLVEVS